VFVSTGSNYPMNATAHDKLSSIYLPPYLL
jgi:hypothetical protein